MSLGRSKAISPTGRVFTFPEVQVDKTTLQALQITKEIVVKFVETGRISPGNFAEHFGPIYREVLRTIGGQAPDGADAGESAGDADETP